MLKNMICKLVDKQDLSTDETSRAMEEIIGGGATPAQIGSFMTALRMKGETADEITGCARVMREKAVKIKPSAGYCIDTCGTGGDGSNTFNISTASAFIAAAGGVTVAKHGNRSVSSRSGSADVLEALGVEISLEPGSVQKCIDACGMGFMFAPVFHKSMKYAAGPRKELGIRTVFNILGPLTNPACADGQVLGVFDGKLTEVLASVLQKLGVEKALVIYGSDGLDEITTVCETKITELKGGRIESYGISPEQFGISRATGGDLAGGDANVNAAIIRDIFSGIRGPQRDVVVLNAAAALYIGKAARDIREGVDIASRIIDSGKAMSKLEQLAAFTQDRRNEGMQECCNAGRC